MQGKTSCISVAWKLRNTLPVLKLTNTPIHHYRFLFNRRIRKQLFEGVIAVELYSSVIEFQTYKTQKWFGLKSKKNQFIVEEKSVCQAKQVASR